MKTVRFALIVIAIAGFILWRANPPLFFSLMAKAPPFKVSPQVKSAFDKKQKEIAKEVQKQTALLSSKAAIETKKGIALTVEQAAQQVTKLLATKTDDVLGILTTRQNQEPVVSFSKTLLPPPAEIKTINFTSTTPHKLTVKSKEKSFIQFQNVPPKICLFINGVKYSVENNTYATIVFPAVGTYSLSLDYCSISDKQLGEIVVE